MMAVSVFRSVGQSVCRSLDSPANSMREEEELELRLHLWEDVTVSMLTR